MVDVDVNILNKALLDAILAFEKDNGVLVSRVRVWCSVEPSTGQRIFKFAMDYGEKE